MGAIEVIGIIVALGFVSMIEICAIVTCVNRMIDQKMKTKVELELKVWKEEMDYLDKSFEKFFNQLLTVIKESKKE